jgi:Flp pilus assembly protein TadG
MSNSQAPIPATSTAHHTPGAKDARRRWRTWWRSDRGSVSAEITLVAPLLVLLLVLVAVVIHRGVNARLRLDDVAHQAARAASMQRTPAAAESAARTIASTALAEAGVTCVSTGAATNSAGFRPGGAVAVTVTCSVDLGDALLLGVPGSKQLAATATEPIDAWRSTPDTRTTP